MSSSGKITKQKIYFDYWGKAWPAAKDENVDIAAGHHLLVFHCLDVAAVASQWWDQSPALRLSFIAQTGFPEAQAKAWLLFYIALHDLGKFDIRFQLKAPEALQRLWPKFNADEDANKETYFHGPQGFLVFRKQITNHFGFDADNTQTWLGAVAGHHGDLQMRGEWRAPDAEDWVINKDQQARFEWINTLIDLFLEPASIDPTTQLPACPPMLAGFCSICDWVGSNNDFFAYNSTPGGKDLAGYWATTLITAAPLIEKFGLHRRLAGTKGMLGLFPKMRPRQVQTVLHQLSTEQGLTLIEAPTGSGKTEAALAFASELLAAKKADSIIFALPTQATANAMLARLEAAASSLYERGSNVVLAHGRAWFNQDFKRIKAVARKGDVQGEEAAQVQCAQWLGESRKRVFLGQIGVCTIDQVLISVLPVRHNFVRAFGVQKSVLIIDEVHAYDAYMYGLLTTVLEHQRQAGGSAILLSATLPASHINKLISAWGAKPRTEPNTTLPPYPLLTQVYNNNIHAIKIADESQLPAQREVHTTLLATADCLPNTQLIEQILAAAQQGALVGIVCNLVVDAQQLYQILLDCSTQNIAIDIFHARYVFADRQHHEQQVLEHYGKDAPRSQGRILVATQVIEQSLDLDFDWLISQICPVDLLFQRFGRLHRHRRNNRPDEFAQVPEATIIVPTTAEDFGLHQLVYASGRLLWRTKKLLEQMPVVAFPFVYRDWIERVYDEAPWPGEPAAIERSHEEYSIKSEATYYCARQLAHMPSVPAADTDENVACMTRDGDMNLSLLLLCESDNGPMTIKGDKIDELEEWDKQEVMLLSTVGVPASWQKWLPDKNSDGVIQIAMAKVGSSWLLREKDISLSYDNFAGLGLTKK
ncbi:MAG: CRISPR-associated helicase/endonuclease Cas3 [Pseudomonadales bacterium]|nr:CRISPR-associated helicase/endonuclease Cas3 [Pseudomonadales bacterium]